MLSRRCESMRPKSHAHAFAPLRKHASQEPRPCFRNGAKAWHPPVDTYQGAACISRNMPHGRLPEATRDVLRQRSYNIPRDNMLRTTGPSGILNTMPSVNTMPNGVACRV